MKFSAKGILSTAMLVATAVGAVADVIAKDKKDKEFEQMKKTLDELTKKGN